MSISKIRPAMVDPLPPLSEAEQDALLAEAGFDVDAGLKKALALVAYQRAKAQVDLSWKGVDEMLALLTPFESAIVHRSREESLALIRQLAHSSEGAERELREHPDYLTFDDEGLDTVVAALQAWFPAATR